MSMTIRRANPENDLTELKAKIAKLTSEGDAYVPELNARLAALDQHIQQLAAQRAALLDERVKHVA